MSASHDPGMSAEAVVEATGHDWVYWREHIDALGGADMPHAAIVQSLADTGMRDWWRQMVTVGYERMIGRREPGQTCAGDYSAGASRTFPGDMDSVLARWCELVAGRIEYAGALVTGQPRTSSSEKWRYWRVDLGDGSKVAINIANKPGDKATLGVSHDKLESAEAATAAKAFWKQLLAEA